MNGDGKRKGISLQVGLSGLRPGDRLMAGGYDWSWAFVVFREVLGYPRYTIGTDGSVWSNFKGSYHQLSPGNVPSGHLFVNFSDEGKPFGKSIHRLVIEHFISGPPGGKECCHNNGNPTDNRVANLRWGTRKENSHDAVKHGAIAHGERSGKSRLQEFQVREIYELVKSGKSGREIAAMYGVHKSVPEGISKGRIWKHLGLEPIYVNQEIVKGYQGSTDLTGRTFGNLTVIDYYRRDDLAYKKGMWRCICKCGNQDFAVTSDLLHGLVKGCGRGCTARVFKSRKKTGGKKC